MSLSVTFERFSNKSYIKIFDRNLSLIFKYTQITLRTVVIKFESSLINSDMERVFKIIVPLF